MLGVGCYSGANGDRARHSRELPGFDDAAKLLCDSETVLRVGLRQEDRELLTAVAADDIDLAKLLVKQRRDLAEDFVAEQVSELVIQALELVDIEHDNGHATLKAAGPFQLLSLIHI